VSTASRETHVLVEAAPHDRPPGIEEVGPGVEVRYAMGVDELRARLPGCEVVFAWEQDRDALEAAWGRAGDVRWLQASSAGVDGLLFAALVESDVVVTNARGVFDGAIAEYVLGLMIAFARDLRTTFEDSRAGAWRHRETPTVAGRRLVVVGPGPIGRAIARLARAVGMSVSAVGRSPRPGDAEFERIDAAADLPAAVAGADHVVVVTPLTPSTRGLVGAEALAAMGAQAHLINVGRGEVVDEDALVEALRAGTIAGASLDVFATEPLPDGHPLWGMRNVVVSPHMSGDFTGWERAAVAVFLDNLERWRRGEPLRNVVDKAAGFGAGGPVRPSDGRSG
jgi:phosphoglycerate dehydrogenase-like enzyme